MVQLYTPFLTQAGAAIGRGLERRFAREEQGQRNQLIQSAYMQQPGALEQLMSVDPQAAMQVKKQVTEEQQAKVQSDQAKQDRIINARKQLAEQIDPVKKQLVNFENYDQAKAYFDRTIEQNRPLMEVAEVDPGTFTLTPDGFNKLKTAYGEEKKSAFGGTSMDAQVSNALVKGADDPAYRNTPEYARAWQLANEPKIIRTPTGDIKLPPDLPSIFKAPGTPDLSPKEEIKQLQNKAETDAKLITDKTKEDNKPVYIPGTERSEKYTEGEKKAAGFYDRMTKAETDIAGLKDFNPIQLSEKVGGITNITASPDYQKYMQAAKDWSRAKLRWESGAVITQEEIDNEYKTYFPVFGDSPEVIEQKSKSREIATESMRKNAGNAIKEEGPKTYTTLPPADQLKVGDIVFGKKYKGGNVADPNSWE